MLCLALAAAGPAIAQSPASGIRDRPFATEREVPRAEEAPGERALGTETGEGEERVLPAVPAPSEAEVEALGAQAGLVVRSLELVGNSALPDEAFLRAAAPFLGRPLDSAELERLRRVLTAVYVDAGYVTSGARLPEQTVTEGRLRVELVEGRLAEIRIAGARHYRESVLRRRLERGAGPPVRVPDLEAALRILSQDPRIARLDARLEPGSSPGTSNLFVAIEEADPASLLFGIDNHLSPSVGAYAGSVDVAHANPLGLGDRLGAEVMISEGLYRVAGSYSLPLHPSGTELLVDARYTQAEILDPLLDEVDVRNESLSYSVGLNQTLYRTPSDWIEAGLAFDLRESRSTIGGDPFLTPSSDFGRTAVRALRANTAWTRRMRASALTLRSIASFGLDVLDATMHHRSIRHPLTNALLTPNGNIPEARFTSWVGQLRFFHRFERGGIELDLRGDVQLADGPLLSLEQFVIGGPGSVRGYRTNQLVGDEGFSSGVEVRLPLLRTVTGRRVLSLAPFAEVGRVSWKGDHVSPGKRTLSSLGTGLEWAPRADLSLRVDWAGALRDTGQHGDLQDHGVTFRVTWRAR
ncbi:MAG: ShlB/FhaC/HecB family hemolysin secretion/activation protein [Deltaproteobacteria bacterium]|nr:ShlB/FhaC/HecB family hemolysin secretion/activation protein [Deltaproteobacteria bacterium]